MRIMIIDPGFEYSTLAVAESYCNAFADLGYDLVEYDMLKALNINREGLKSLNIKAGINELTELSGILR